MSSVGLRLKKLRVDNGYSQRKLAEYLEIDQSNLSKIENDKRTLNMTLLDKICNLYNCTPEYLLGESDKYQKPRILFKSGRDVDLNVISKANQISYHLKMLNKFDCKKGNVHLPNRNINLKRKWGIDNYSPINLFNILPQKIQNLTILWFPMNRSVSGCYFKQDGNSIIFINSIHSKGRQNFTIAHELYHLLDDNNYYFICSDANDSLFEKKADDFASNFLVSDYALYDFMDRNDISNWSIDDVIKCEQYFQLDHNHFIRRLFKNKLIDESQFAEFSFNIIGKASSLGYDTSLYEQSPENKLYYSVGHMIPLIENVYNQEKISSGKRREILLDIFRTDMIYKSG